MKTRVLIVEDNPTNCYLAKYLLERAGAEVLTADNGSAAVECAKRERPDLVVMDLAIPEMDGYEAFRRMREDPALAHLPAVASTALANAAERERALARGFADFIEKPIDVATFADRVLRCCGQGRSVDRIG